MRDFFRDSSVKDYQPLVERMTNHPKDRHVLAAAVACRFGTSEKFPGCVHLS
jgi:hypothetical protein